MNKSILYVKGENGFRTAAYIIVGILSVIAFLPILLIIIASFTEENVLVANGYSYFPAQFSIFAYQYLTDQLSTIARAYGISIIVTLLGTVMSIMLTTMIAFPLSRKDFKARNIISFIIFFTMLFNGGVVSSYIMWTRFFHVTNTIWALIFPNYMVTAFNVFMVRNYYSTSVPYDIIEAAKIDGATEAKIYFSLMLPLSKPVVATIALFTGLLYWNDWTNSIYYITKPLMYSIQYYLMVLMQDIQFLQSGNAASVGVTASLSSQMPATAIRMALAVIGILPVIVAFPFFQKHIVKGVVMGAVKG